MNALMWMGVYVYNVSNVAILLFSTGWIASGILHFGLMNAYSSFNYGKNTAMLLFISLAGYCALLAAVLFLIIDVKPFKHGIKFNVK